MCQYFLLAEVNDVTREEGLVIMGENPDYVSLKLKSSNTSEAEQLLDK